MTNAANNTQQQRWILPVTLAIAFFMENMDANIIATSLPQIANATNTTPVALKLAMTSYLISLCILTPISGWIVDNFSARATFRYSIIIFLAGSLLCAASQTLCFFVVARFLQGIGGAMMVPVARLVILRATQKEDLVSALSWFSIPALTGPLIGPPIGGFITTYFSWHWIFLINIPIGILALICAAIYMPKKEVLVKYSLDIKGFILSATAVVTFIFGTSIVSQPNLPKEYGLALTVIGIISAIAYYKYAQTAKSPLFSVKLFNNNVFRKCIIGGSLFRIGIGAIPFLVPLMFQLCFKMSALESGCLVFIAAAGSIFMKTAVKFLFDRFRIYYMLIIGTVISAAFIAIYGLFTQYTPYWLILTILFFSGFLRSMFFSAINALGFSEISKEEMSQATPLHAVATQVSIALGIAIAGIVLETCSTIHGGPNTLRDFRYAFYIVGFLSMSSVFVFASFDKNVGSSLRSKNK